MACSWHVHGLFKACLWHVHGMFTACSWHVNVVKNELTLIQQKAACDPPSLPPIEMEKKEKID